MSREKGGLGKGLDALIPRGEGGLVHIELDQISPNPHQPRTHMEEGPLAELAESILKHGLLQPLIVTRAGSGYTLVAGERRWRASRLAGLSTVPALVKEASPSQLLEMALVENVQRQDLNPLEEAAAYRQLIDEHGLTQEEVAARVAKSRSAVANQLRLLQLSDEAKEALAQGRITEGHARAILSLSNPEQQKAMLVTLLAGGITVRQAEEAARRESTRRVAVPSPELAELEDRLREALRTKVELHRGRKGGRLVIHFYSDEELEAIYQLLGAGE
ncbi:MAG TPA: ParB/RepB/Spo0J family partition protein [Chloroflexota bacterium]|nr:ParB/RepB/Spo0J family partition protein [Chloroflexota bacterium]